MIVVTKFRVEKDSMGELNVPSDALWGAQTQRAINNFPISGLQLSRTAIRSLGLIKAALAFSNHKLGHLAEDISKAIMQASLSIAEGAYDSHFPIDIFQTGSGTSSNMNANEVIANLATEILGSKVHPNDHVNMGQSSNDVIPSIIHIAATLAVVEKLIPSMEHLRDTINNKAKDLQGVVKTGRTHLMDAMPVTFGQELGGWAAQIDQNIDRIKEALPRISAIALGGTAVGTGINADPKLSSEVTSWLSENTGINFSNSSNFFEGLSSQDSTVELSGKLKNYAVSITKISNDLRWMNSGPLAGLGEIALPALQPGSSIMPGKVNPVIPEAAAMVSAQVLGNDVTIGIAGQSGNFQLNVMLPVILYNIMQSLDILSNISITLADKAIKDFVIIEENLKSALSRNPILVTALNPVIGYEKGAYIAKKAYKEGRAVLDVALEETDLTEEELNRLLDPYELTKGGIKS
jgi:fumarate hydratase, class II